MLLHLPCLLGNLGLFFYPWFNEALEAGSSCQQGCQQETQLREKGSELEPAGKSGPAVPSPPPTFPTMEAGFRPPVLCSSLPSYPREGDSGVLPGVFTPKATQRNCLR